MGDEAVAVRGKYESEAQKARAALDGEVRGATVRRPSGRRVPVGPRRRYGRRDERSNAARKTVVVPQVAIREERDGALRRLRHAEALLDAQGGRHAGALRKARASCGELKKKLSELQRRRKLELEGYGRDVAELRGRMERVKLAQRRVQERDENADPSKAPPPSGNLVPLSRLSSSRR